MKKRKIFFITLIVSLVPIHSYAQETSKNKNVEVVEVDDVKIKDDSDVSGDVMSIRQIQKLISGKYKYKDSEGVTHTRMRKEYTKALQELYKFIDKYPNRFDEAERIIRDILKRREEYYKLFDELVAYSNEHPDDLKGCGERVEEMENLEDDPPEEIKDLMKVFKEMYLYKYYDWKFHNALKNSSDLTHEKKYTDSILQISNEFSTYEKEFYNDWEYYPEITNEAESILGQLTESINEFNKLQTSFDVDISNLTKLISDNNFEQADLFYPVVENDFEKLRKIQNSVVDCARKYEQLHQKILKINPLVTDASYLPFMRRFISGISEYSDSGILGAIDYQWQDKIAEVKDAVAGKTKKLVDDYKKVLPERIVEADDYYSLEDTSLYIDPITNYSELGCKVNDITEGFQIWNDDNYKKNQDYENSMIFVQGLTEQSEKIITLGEQLSMETEVQQGLLQIFENNKGNISFSQRENLDSLFESVDKMRNILGDKNNLLVENMDWSKGYLSSESEEQSLDWNEYKNIYDDYIQQSYEHVDDTVVKVWDGITGTYKDNADIYANELLKYIEVAEIFHNGFEESISNEDYNRIKDNPDLLVEYALTHKAVTEENKEIAKCYPELTVTLSDYILEHTELNKNLLKSAKESFENVSATYSDKDNKTVNEIVKNAGEYISNKIKAIDEQEKETNRKLTSAKDDYDKVIRTYTTVDRLLDEAQRAFTEGSLELSKQLNEQAWQEEISSWGIMDNPNRAAQIEKKYSSLNDKINDALNNEIIYKTRALYERARNEMSNEHYTEALDLINQAINKWAETHNTEKNDEFEDLRELINTIVNLQNNREFNPSDPLYAEMSQLLSQANIYYDNGEKLIKEGKKKEGELELQKAQDNLDKIKKIYPLNKDVSYLKLKIEFLIDPVSFEKHLKNRIEDEEKKTKNKNTLNEGITELESLLELFPNNKDLAKKIDNIKIANNLKEKPIDTSAKNKAARLVKEAESLYNKGQYSQASSKINEAIRLDYTNQYAKRLKDDIERRKGSQKSTSTKSESNTTKPSAGTSTGAENNREAAALYESAKRYFNNGKYQQAYIQLKKIQSSNPAYYRRSDVQNLLGQIERYLR